MDARGDEAIGDSARRGNKAFVEPADSARRIGTLLERRGLGKEVDPEEADRRTPHRPSTGPSCPDHASDSRWQVDGVWCLMQRGPYATNMVVAGGDIV